MSHENKRVIMRRSWVALALLLGLKVHCFALSPLHPTPRRPNPWKNEYRPIVERYPYVFRLATGPEQSSSDYADIMLPPDERLDIAPTALERHHQWLEMATAELLDLNTFPMGTLTPDNVESISGLMAAWVRRRSVDAALMVEELLKRVVDDLRAGNRSIKVTARMYTIVSAKNILQRKFRCEISKYKLSGVFLLNAVSHSFHVARQWTLGPKAAQTVVPSVPNTFTMP